MTGELGHRPNGGTGYCDDYCILPTDHDGEFCYGEQGQVWRDATPEEAAAFSKMRAGRHA